MWLYLIYSNYAYLWSTDSRYSLLTATIALKFFWCWVVIAKSSDTKENWFIFKTPSVSSIMYLLQTIYALLPRFFFNLFGNQTAPYKCHTETDRAFLTENFFLFWCHNEAELKRQEGSSMIWALFILVFLLTIYWTGVLCSEPLQAVSRQLADNSFLI